MFRYVYFLFAKQLFKQYLRCGDDIECIIGNVVRSIADLCPVKGLEFICIIFKATRY